MSRILIVYASAGGHTRGICERMAARIVERGDQAELVTAEQVGDLDPEPFDAIAVGGSVIYGFHDKRLGTYLKNHARTIGKRPNAFFSVNLIARKPEKRNIEGNKYVRKFLDKLSFTPGRVEIIAGKLDYPSYRFLDRVMIQLIMKYTDGPTDKNVVVDYTDYDQVDRFADWLSESAREKAEAQTA